MQRLPFHPLEVHSHHVEGSTGDPVVRILPKTVFVLLDRLLPLPHLSETKGPIEQGHLPVGHRRETQQKEISEPVEESVPCEVAIAPLETGDGVFEIPFPVETNTPPVVVRETGAHNEMQSPIDKERVKEIALRMDPPEEEDEAHHDDQ